jgi:hypothetical protein
MPDGPKFAVWFAAALPFFKHNSLLTADLEQVLHSRLKKIPTLVDVPE